MDAHNAGPWSTNFNTFLWDLLRKGTILKIKVYIYFFLPGYFKAQNEVMRLHRVQEAFVRYS